MVTICRGKYVLDTRVGDTRVRLQLTATNEADAEIEAAEAIKNGALLCYSKKPRYSNYRDNDLYELLRKTKHHAEQRRIEFAMTRDDVRGMYVRSGEACEITRIKFDRLFKPEGAGKRPYAASIDRIESAGIYTPDNCRLVCSAVNMALGEWGMPVFERISEAMLINSKSWHRRKLKVA